MSTIKVEQQVVIGHINGERVIQLRVEDGEIITDTSACLPVRNPARHIELYMECLKKARKILVHEDWLKGRAIEEAEAGKSQ